MTLESQTYTTSGAPADDEAQAGPGRQDSQPAVRRPHRRGGPMALLRKVWLPVVILLVVAVAAFGVFRLHGVFGKTETTRPGSGLANDTKPFNPKTVVYEIYGPPGAVATINYLDLDAQPQIVRDVTLPWSLTLTTTAPAASANIVAQGDTDTIGCRITVNGELKDEKTSTGVNAQTFCLVKSA
ncbi:hypothetical protein MSZK_05720 [Mycobacterium sp. shizuoka-1]|nr:hypothetical protein MSZK_05720 [Mycobacterium sp. shizuoka-1]